MPEIFSNLIPKTRVKSWWLKYGSLIMIVILFCLLIMVIYLLYREYYQPVYRLTNLLPSNYTLAIEIKNDEENLPKIIVEELLRQPTLKNIYQETAENIAPYLKKLPPLLSDLIKKPGEHLFFLVDQETFGLIIKLNDKDEAEAIKNSSFPGLYHQVIKKQILVISNKPEIIDQISSQPFSPLSPFNFSLSFAPWLTIYFQDSFFQQTFDYQLLTDFQTVLLPLKITGQKSYRLEFTNAPHQLILELKPEKLNKTAPAQVDLDDYLRYLPNNYDLILGLSDLNNFTNELSANENLNHYFKQADLWLWLKTQTSLSRLIKELQGPMVIAASSQQWQIVAEAVNQTALDYYLRRYLAQFTPLKKTITLPDETLAVELIADPQTITWETSSNKDWQTFGYPLSQTDDKIGYAIKENLLIISNKINNFLKSDFENQCDLAKISALFSINPQKLNWLTIEPLLKNFAKITAISSNDGQIKLCLEYEE